MSNESHSREKVRWSYVPAPEEKQTSEPFPMIVIEAIAVLLVIILILTATGLIDSVFHF